MAGQWTRRPRRRYMLAALVIVALLIVAVVVQATVTGIEVVDIDISLSALRTAVHQVTGQTLTHLLATYGYWAVLLTVAVESTGIPVPGETMLLSAAVYAGATHHLAVPLVIGAAAAGAILGDNLGYLAGREGGYRLLRRYGPFVRLTDRRLALGQYLFRRHGGKVVFLGRFVAVLRMWAAFLAGAHYMPWPRFLAFNAAGGLLWATVYGVGGALLGHSMQTLTGLVGVVAIALALCGMAAVFLILRHAEQRLEDDAQRTGIAPLRAHPQATGTAPDVGSETTEDRPVVTAVDERTRVCTT